MRFLLPLLLASCITPEQEAQVTVTQLQDETWVEIEAPLSGYRCFVLDGSYTEVSLCAPTDRAIVKANVYTLDEQTEYAAVQAMP